MINESQEKYLYFLLGFLSSSEGFNGEDPYGADSIFSKELITEDDRKKLEQMLLELSAELKYKDCEPLFDKLFKQMESSVVDSICKENQSLINHENNP